MAISAAFEQMQKQFQHELRMSTASQRSLSLKGTPLTNITSAKNIARSSPSIEKLQLTSVVQASAVGQFSKYGKALGNGLIVVDVASRIGNVQKAYKTEGDWERELFVESSSFAVSALAGTLTAKAGIAFFVLATPAGWVGLIVVAEAVSMGAACILFVIFGQVTVHKLRKTPETKRALGIEFASGWDILNVAQALSVPESVEKSSKTEHFMQMLTYCTNTQQYSIGYWHECFFGHGCFLDLD